MKRLLVLLLPALLFLGCKNNSNGETKAQKNQQVQEQQEPQMLVGKVTRADLAQPPYGEWFQEEYNSYELDTVTLDSITNRDFNMTIVLGTWCPDSRREVPRMYKILDYLGVPDSNLTVICVDRDKKAGQVDISGLNIERIPTFIVYIDGREKGRIVERPQMSLEIDLKNIVQE